MTKHTPEFLRARASNLSLRSAALASSTSLVAASPPVTAMPTPSAVDAYPQPGSGNEQPRAKATTMTDEARYLIAGDLMRDVERRELRACIRCAVQVPYSVDHIVQAPVCPVCAVRDCRPEVFTKPFCDFLTGNPTVFHAVDYFKAKLEEAGYKEVR